MVHIADDLGMKRDWTSINWDTKSSLRIPLDGAEFTLTLVDASAAPAVAPAHPLLPLLGQLLFWQKCVCALLLATGALLLLLH